jgi:hypothetical protein
MSEPKTTPPVVEQIDETALQVERDLDAMYAIKTNWEFEEIRPQSETIYNMIFDVYDADHEENGITTDKYSFLEDKSAVKEDANEDEQDPVFILKLK